MNLDTFFAAFAVFAFVATSPAQTRLASNPAQALLKRGADLKWSPPNAYERQTWQREKWKDKCDAALTEAGCGAGIIHQGQRWLRKPNGEKGYYVNVEGAPSMDMMEQAKKMRIFEDGTVEEVDRWPKKDWKGMVENRNPKKGKKRKLNAVAKGRNALLVWDPTNAYEKQPLRGARWEGVCDIALTREGCGFGTIHKGTRQKDNPNGEETHYLNVEGRPSKDVGPTKKMRVFLDGSSETVPVWSAEEINRMRRSKIVRKAPTWRGRGLPRQEVQKESPQALLFWDPINSYQHFPHKKPFWEKRCDPALTREDCIFGIIHQGETKVVKPTGEKTSYINVEGISGTDLGLTKLMRVYWDGTTEHGWSDRDRKLMAQAKIGMRQRSRLSHVKALESPMEYDHDGSKQTVSWDPPNVYKSRPRMREHYETVCRHALRREECDMGIIYQGQRHLENNDGSNIRYMNASVGKQDDPENTKHMRLFEDGTYQWYSPGTLPKELEKKKEKGKGNEESIGTRAQGTDERSTKRPRQQERRKYKKKGNEESTHAQAQGADERPRKRPRRQESTGAQLHEPSPAQRIWPTESSPTWRLHSPSESDPTRGLTWR